LERRSYNVSLGAVGTPIPWNLHGPNAIKEKFGVGKAMYYVHHL